jgi:hypothetical protein
MHAFSTVNQTFVKISTACQNHFLRAEELGPRLSEIERGLKVMHHLDDPAPAAAARRFKRKVVGNHDRLAARQSTANRLQSSASHQHGLAHGNFAKVFKIARQMPRQAASVARLFVAGP